MSFWNRLDPTYTCLSPKEMQVVKEGVRCAIPFHDGVYHSVRQLKNMKPETDEEIKWLKALRDFKSKFNISPYVQKAPD